MGEKIQHSGGITRFLLPLLSVLCVAAILFMAAVLTKGNIEDSAAEFIPPKFDQAAQAGEPEVAENLGYGMLDAQAYSVALCGSPLVRDGKAILYLTNPKENKVWLKVRILDSSDKVIGQSGLLKQGQYVEAVSLDDVPQNDMQVQLKIMAYQPETYHSAGAAVLSTNLIVE